MKLSSLKLGVLGAAALGCLAMPARADTLAVDLAGWTAVDDFGIDGNTFVLRTLPAGAVVSGFSYANLSFSTDPSDLSWLVDLTLSVNQVNGDTLLEYLDWKPSSTEGPGSAGPLAGSWGGATGSPGYYGAGGSFTMGTGDELYITVYLADYYPSAGITVSAGTLSINYTPATPVPEPATYAMFALGMLGVAGLISRRRRVD